MCPCIQPPTYIRTPIAIAPPRKRPGELRNASSQGLTKLGRNAPTRSMSGTMTSAGLAGPRPGFHLSITGNAARNSDAKTVRK